MANPEHLKILKRGIVIWNKWRRENPDIRPDLANVALRGENLRFADFSGAQLNGADFSGGDLTGSNLSHSDLTNAFVIKGNLTAASLAHSFINRTKMTGSNCFGASFSYAHVSESDFCNTNLIDTDFTGASIGLSDFTEATIVGAALYFASIIQTNLTRATLTDCSVYGISAWDIEIEDIRKQKNLFIAPGFEKGVCVDNLEVAQFVYLLLNNEKIRSVINTIGEKCVLILGRFTPERKAVLDAIRDKLRVLGFVPMMFDFEKPTQRDFTETIKTLAGMSRFIIADITNPKSAPLELQAILPHYMIPLVPILQDDEKPFAMFRDLDQKYRQWVLPRLEYDTPENLIKVMDNAIIKRALKLADELRVIKAQERQAEHVKDYL